MKIDALFQQQNALPMIPKVVQEVIDSFNNDSVSIDEIAKKLSADQVLSAKLLRLANSSYYHASRTVGTVDDAVLMLGFMTVRTLVVSSGLTGGFKSMPGIDLKQFWRFSLYVAVAAKWLAKKSQGNSDFSFTVGLMHAIGQLVMHAGMPEQMLQIDKIAPPLDARRADIERSSFAYNYFEVGAELARRWRFPDSFATAIGAAENPLDKAEFDKTGAIVHLAAWRARAIEFKYNEEEMSATFPLEVAKKAGISSELMLSEMPPLEELCAGLEDLIS